MGELGKVMLEGCSVGENGCRIFLVRTVFPFLCVLCFSIVLTVPVFSVTISQFSRDVTQLSIEKLLIFPSLSKGIKENSGRN